MTLTRRILIFPQLGRSSSIANNHPEASHRPHNDRDRFFRGFTSPDTEPVGPIGLQRDLEEWADHA